MKILEFDVGDGEVGRVVGAEGEVLLAVALRHFDGVVDVADGHGVVGDVADGAEAASALQVARQRRLVSRPDFDAGAVGRVRHADVVDVDVGDEVGFARVLAEGSDGDAVGAVAGEVLDDDGGGVGFEGDAVVAVVDGGVLDRDRGAAVGVPAVGVLGRVGGC